MKTILFIHHATGWGGAPINLINIINALDKNEFHARVLLLKDSIVSRKLQENNIECIVASSWFYRKFYTFYTHSVPNFIDWYNIKSQVICWLSWILSHYIFASRELKKIDYDIAHLNSSVLTDWLKPCREKGKVIIHIQEPFSKRYLGIRYHFFTQQMRKYADHIIAISIDNANRINIPDKTTIVYNFSTIEDLEELGIDKYTSKSVLYVGGASSIKGFSTLVDSLQFLNNDISVYFVGFYSSFFRTKRQSIKQKIKFVFFKIFKKKKLNTYNKFDNNHQALNIGQLSNINEYLDKSVCLVSPFTVPHFSRPIIEAFGRRKPSIATNIEGMDEIITDGENGILVPNRDAISLAGAINYLCSNPLIAKKMGDNGFEEANNKYSQRNVKQIVDIYLTLLLKVN